MNDISEEALRSIKETFGARFVWHASSEAESGAEGPFASVFAENAEEVQLLTRLGARYR